METLRDIKEALNKIPDNILERCVLGLGEDSEEIMGLICLDSDTSGQLTYCEVFEKYPELIKLSNLIENMRHAQKIIDEQDREKLLKDLQQRGVTDTYFGKKK